MLMGPTTMASPNGAQASEFSPTPLTHASFDEYSIISELNTEPTLKLNITKVMNNEKQFQPPTPSTSSSSAKVTRLLGLDQEDYGGKERLATYDMSMLIQSGAVDPGYNEGWSRPSMEAKPEVPFQLSHKWSTYEQPSMGLLGSTLSAFDGVTLNSGFTEGQQTGMPAMPMSMATSISSEIIPNNEIKDKSIERKQKRMIKNRESAARSRARKQAYIKQLEDTVKRLEDTNMQLKRQLEDMLSQSDSMPEPRYQLRRTSSDQFN